MLAPFMHPHNFLGGLFQAFSIVRFPNDPSPVKVMHIRGFFLSPDQGSPIPNYRPCWYQLYRLVFFFEGVGLIASRPSVDTNQYTFTPRAGWEEMKGRGKKRPSCRMMIHPSRRGYKQPSALSSEIIFQTTPRNKINIGCLTDLLICYYFFLFRVSHTTKKSNFSK